MPTEIRIVLPDTGTDDNLSTITETDNYETSSNSNARDNIGIKTVKEKQRYDKKTRNSYNGANRGLNLKHASSVKPSNGHCKVESFALRPTKSSATKQQEENILCSERRISSPQHKTRVVLQQTQHQMLDEDIVPSLVLVEKSRTIHPSPPKTATSVSDKSTHTFQNAEYEQAIGEAKQAGKSLRLSLTETYDVDLEQQDMMMKALQSYGLYQSQGEESNKRRPRSGAPLWDDKLSHRTMPVSAHGQPPGSRGLYRTDSCYSRISYESISSEKSAPVFRLAQCQLRYNDDGEEDKRRYKKNGLRKKTSSSKGMLKDRNVPQRPKSAVLYPRGEMNGVLVDSVGHVYRASQTARPRSSLPCKVTDLGRISGREFALDRFEKSSVSTEPSSRSKDPQQKRPVSGGVVGAGTAGRILRQSSFGPRQNSTSGCLTVLNLRLDGAALPTRSMSGQPPHSVAFDRRNRTTHAWGDSGCLSQSMPSASFLRSGYGTRSLGGSSASSPRSVRGEPTSFSERTSPAGKPSDPSKPSASYSYDGGFFVGASSGKAEYFVIHPDWVSEMMTIKKLSVSSAEGGRKNKGGPPVSNSAHFRPRSLQGRRCLSAPPQKRRNPITWVDSSFLADASNFDACGDAKTGSTSGVTNGEACK
ncbi:hypothetical protein EGW08_007184 [Elysia chlorotica]|uniref:Uncharacterized protein n=1 Tax=Elysia chlorotica TaxID=188477 RepID=A0A433TU10_ELYCH|nr:hypothetical protein EGW08_007184 [Elysia chlorotica]